MLTLSLVAELVLAMLNLCDDEKEEAEEEKKELTEAEKEKNRERLRKKVRGVAKMLRMFTILRQERETIMQIKSFTPENKIPTGLLTKGVDAIRDALGDFEKAKNADIVNEKRPESHGLIRGGSNPRIQSFLQKMTNSLTNITRADPEKDPK